MIERWLTAIRDHPQRPAAMQCHVLTMLALRLNWESGTGFCSTTQLMTDADASKSTVMRATSWARRSELLLRTRRGHRVSADVVIASEWQLTQGVTADTLAVTQGVNGSNPRCQQDRPKVSAETHHQESSTSEPSPSLARALSALQDAGHDVTEREAGAILQNLAANGARDSLAVLRSIIKDGRAAEIIIEAQQAQAAILPAAAELCGRCGGTGHARQDCLL